MEYRYTFRLKTERDEDLIAWLESLGEGERSFHIRQTLRQGLHEGRPLSALPAISATEEEESSWPMANNAQETPLSSGDDLESRLDLLANSF